MSEYQICKGCGKQIMNDEHSKHYKNCFPDNYEGVVYTGYKQKD